MAWRREGEEEERAREGMLDSEAKTRFNRVCVFFFFESKSNGWVLFIFN